MVLGGRFSVREEALLQAQSDLARTLLFYCAATREHCSARSWSGVILLLSSPAVKQDLVFGADQLDDMPRTMMGR
jgi:hypothetical protein